MKYNPFQVSNSSEKDKAQAWEKSKKPLKFKKLSENPSFVSRQKKEKSFQQNISKADDVFELQPIKRKSFRVNSEDVREMPAYSLHEQILRSVPPFNQDKEDDLFEIRQELARRKMISEPHNNMQHDNSENERFWNHDFEGGEQGATIIMLDSNSRRVSENYRKIEEERAAYYSSRTSGVLFSYVFKICLLLGVAIMLIYYLYPAYQLRENLRPPQGQMADRQSRPARKRSTHYDNNRRANNPNNQYPAQSNNQDDQYHKLNREVKKQFYKEMKRYFQ